MINQLSFFTLSLMLSLVISFSQTQITKTEIASLRQLAKQGDAESQVLLGNRYHYGIRVPMDYQEAIKWFRKAAEQGNANAQHNLGLMYHNNEGVLQDYKEAAKWYSKSAHQGHALAQYDLGVMYYFGMGVPKDYILAYMWASLAVVSSSSSESKSRSFYPHWDWSLGKVRELSVDLQNDVEASMNQEQVAEAQRLARKWSEKHQP